MKVILIYKINGVRTSSLVSIKKTETADTILEDLKKEYNLARIKLLYVIKVNSEEDVLYEKIKKP